MLETTAVADVLRETTMTALKLAAPPLLTALVVGLLVSAVQAMTQINEATLSFVPKALLVTGVLALLGSFMTTTLIDYTHGVMDRVVAAGAQ